MNEHDIIIFSDHKIYCVQENESENESDEECDDLEDLLEQEDDIYSDEHPWDTRVYQYRFRPDVVFYGFIF
jgi:hypothetical protein